MVNKCIIFNEKNSFCAPYVLFNFTSNHSYKYITYNNKWNKYHRSWPSQFSDNYYNNKIRSHLTVSSRSKQYLSFAKLYGKNGIWPMIFVLLKLIGFNRIFIIIFIGSRSVFKIMYTVQSHVKKCSVPIVIKAL